MMQQKVFTQKDHMLQTHDNHEAIMRVLSAILRRLDRIDDTRRDIANQDDTKYLCKET